MGTTNDHITPNIAAWISRQRMFFVATAPLAAEGMVNCSPKGLDTFRILGPREVAYLALTGSGIRRSAGGVFGPARGAGRDPRGHHARGGLLRVCGSALRLLGRARSTYE